MKSIRRLVATGLTSVLIACNSTTSPEPAPVPDHFAVVRVSFTGSVVWPETRQLELGIFADNRESALSVKIINPLTDGQFGSYTLGFNTGASVIMVYLASSEGVPFHVLSEQPVSSIGDTVFCEIKNVNLLDYCRIQNQVFSQCLTCHGGSSGIPAADLDLTDGVSWSNLSGAGSVMSSKLRVAPGDTAASFLWDVALQNELSFHHSYSSSLSAEDIRLLGQWIIEGASGKQACGE